ncbi:MAG: hypothetical protein ACI4EK_03800 [Wujia sp.]
MKKITTSFRITCIFYSLALIAFAVLTLVVHKMHLGVFVACSLMTLRFVVSLIDLKHVRDFPILSGIVEGTCAGIVIYYMLAL